MQIRIVKHFGPYAETFRINLQPCSLGEITVSRHTNVEGTEWKSPNINWPGCGDKTREQTAIFLLALQIAVFLAGVLAGTHKMDLAKLNAICECQMTDTNGKVIESF